MLSPTDVHYLVAFLSSVGQPEDVELELGALVLDESSGTRRDVDVCVTRRRPEGLECFLGIEVKAESRPLDIIAIEQLCAKLNDMPSLTARSIVSASGFTAPAERKAERHGVELLRIDDLEPERFASGTTVIAPDLMLEINNFVPTMTVTFDVPDHLGNQVRVKAISRVQGADGAGLPGIRDANSLANSISRQVTDAFLRGPGAAAMQPGQVVEVSELVSFQQPAFLETRQGRCAIRGARVNGTIRRDVQRVTPHLKTLVRHRDNTPFVDCAIAETPEGGLLLLGAQGVPSQVTFRAVSLSERNLSKIRAQKWAAPLRP